MISTIQEQDRKFWQQQEVDKIQMMKQERKLALQHRDRLKRMDADYNTFLHKLKSSSYKVMTAFSCSFSRPIYWLSGVRYSTLVLLISGETE